jgi:hypothetical protein
MGILPKWEKLYSIEASGTHRMIFCDEHGIIEYGVNILQINPWGFV